MKLNKTPVITQLCVSISQLYTKWTSAFINQEDDDDDVDDIVFNDKTLSTGGDAATILGESFEVLNSYKR
mgnify:CR=1 FL=1